ncbi:hypothetical protein D9758_010178 [Tetrapyrgos nigripes]|uniref:Uncharacterized protein n=1 Tax=Tetrapyrgos nigripes TaxID=182062 RepID=A0A8H5FUS3_9AGAR|nr:hypothetical protein D9758_010178 [Tetrapyrgos nigripes]
MVPNVFQESYGRNRESIADMQALLEPIFESHPEASEEHGVMQIPAEYLPDVFKALAATGLDIMTKEEEDKLKDILEQNPGMKASSELVVSFLLAKTASASPDVLSNSSPEGSDGEDLTRGRSQNRYHGEDRSSSSESAGTSRHFSRPPSRSSVPQTPRTSAFDTTRRQRSTPLESAAPSSWSARPKAPHRRKSIDAGNRSDRSDGEAPPSSYARGSSKTRRARAPSNPTSPSPSAVGGLMTSPDPVFSPVFSPSDSPQFTPSRPQSRAHSHNHTFSLDSDRGAGYSSPDEAPLSSQISSLPMPRPHSGDSDSEDEFSSDLIPDLDHDRVSVASTASLEPMERLEALQKSNAEWQRKLRDAEKTLQNRMAEHEVELEELEGKLEELRSELSMAKREEKELRAKERSNITQINSLESEVNKLNKQLETTRNSYQTLQKTYQEQCSHSERNRAELRDRDEKIRGLREQINLSDLEATKRENLQHQLEDKISDLEAELDQAREAYTELDEQKQENLILKETIDRMRFDMDELRSSLASGINTTSGSTSSAAPSRDNTMSKSLGAEILAKLAAQGNVEEDYDDEDSDDDKTDGEAGSETVVEEVEEGLGSESDGEDIVQTYIRKVIKKKGTKSKTVTRTFEETKEYADTSVQHDPEGIYVVSQIQTDAPPPPPAKADFSIQTTPPASPVRHSIEISTDPIPEPPQRVFKDTEIETDPQELGVQIVEVEKVVEREKIIERLIEVEKEVEREREKNVPRIMIEMEIQTEEAEDEDDEGPSTLASSSSTILPPTPKAQLLALASGPLDDPPAYEPGEDEEEREWRLAAETLKKWHCGMKIPFEAVPNGVSEDALEEWKALKEELGVECEVIDRIIKKSDKTGLPRGAAENGKGKRRKSALYNIYNTYIYKNRGEGSSPSFLTQTIITTVALAGLSTLIAVAIAPHMHPQFHVPGGATVYDRNAWASFNGLQATGEGFGMYPYGQPDGTHVVWNVLGRLGGGAARIVRARVTQTPTQSSSHSLFSVSAHET